MWFWPIGDHLLYLKQASYKGRPKIRRLIWLILSTKRVICHTVCCGCGRGVLGIFEVSWFVLSDVVRCDYVKSSSEATSSGFWAVVLTGPADLG